MTETVLEAAVRRLESAVVRLERYPPATPMPPVNGDKYGDALEQLQRRHDRLRTRMAEAVRSLDALIGDVG